MPQHFARLGRANKSCSKIARPLFYLNLKVHSPSCLISIIRPDGRQTAARSNLHDPQLPYLLLSVRQAKIGAELESFLAVATSDSRRSFQQPFFRSLQIGKCLDIYASITSRHQEKLSRVHSLCRLNKCDFYPVLREYPRFFSRQVFFYNGDFSLSSRNINEKFIALRALAMLGNFLKLPPYVFRHARANKHCGEIIRHLFHLKLNAHFASDSIFALLLSLLGLL
jgi:hypothetical protein